MILLHPCPTCPKGLVEARNTSCVRCVAAFEAEFNPIDPPTTTTQRPTRWRRMWTWLENRFPELGDFAREDDE